MKGKYFLNQAGTRRKTSLFSEMEHIQGGEDGSHSQVIFALDLFHVGEVVCYNTLQ